jgi:hypothetical protein
MEIVEWPSLSLTTFGWMPAPRRRVAAVWRRSWKRRVGSPPHAGVSGRREAWCWGGGVADGVGEDEVVVFPQLTEREALFGLGDAVASECVGGGFADDHLAPGSAGFGFDDGEALAGEVLQGACTCPPSARSCSGMRSQGSRRVGRVLGPATTTATRSLRPMPAR